MNVLLIPTLVIMIFARKAQLALVASAFLGVVDAFWRMNCGIIQTGRLDPILNPGAVSSHSHKISGPSSKCISLQYGYISLTHLSRFWPQLNLRHSPAGTVYFL